jgi:possible tRNA/rRNA methyltransferase
MKEQNQENPISLPTVFRERMKNQLKEEWEAFLEACSKPPKRGIRLNLQKLERSSAFSPEEWIKEWKLEALKPESLKPESLKPESLKLENSKNEAGLALAREYLCDEDYLQSIGVQIGHDAYHEAGLYYIQDPSAMSVVPYMEIRPFDRCLDLCASPGGKSLQMADRLKTEEGGILLSNEFIMERAKNLSKNVERMGYSHVAVSSCSAEELEEHFPAFFSRILVDAPCSGEGMFRKNPEAIADWSMEKVEQCAKLQKDILSHALLMLREGGLLAYSTCTFSYEENEGVRDWILEKHPDLSFLGERYLYFHNSVGEGQYFAIFRKQGNDLKKEDVDSSKTSMLWEKKAKKYFYYPSSLKCFLPLPLLRIGIAVLEEGKKGWEWSHSLSHALDLPNWGEALSKVPEKSVDSKILYSIPLRREDRRVEAYLNGQEIAVGEEELLPFLSDLPGQKANRESGNKGIALCTCDGLPLGFGYYRNGKLRNLYPKGIRFKK